MAHRRTQKPRTKPLVPEARNNALPSIPAAEALSFLRETRGVSTWTARDMADSLKISLVDAKRAIPVLELQGYVKPAGADEWMTTLSGEDVSGSKPPRFTCERIEEALTGLRSRIAEISRDSNAPYKITEAVAFGDFLSGRPRVQSAEVGIQLVPRKPGSADVGSAKEHRGRQEFLQRLQGRGGVVHVRPFENWMSARTHRPLL
jgi:hypothetical protein